MLKAIIVDDELKGRSLLRRMLGRFCPGVEIVAEAQSAAEARELIGSHRPDLLFLDIEMPGEDGFAMLKSLGEVPFSVVFVTAHDHYAIDAIRMSALDYLLKPVDAGELKRAVARAEEHRASTRSDERIGQLLDRLSTARTRIGIPTRRGIVYVESGEIIRCEAESNYTTLHLAGGQKHVAARTLREFEEMLAAYDFIRVHQSHLVNSTHIRQYIKEGNGYLILSDNSRVEVSRRFRERLFRRLPHL